MGEYVININWGGGRSGGGGGNTTTPSFLMNPATATAAATTTAAASSIPANNAAFWQFTNNGSANQRQYIPLTPTQFLSGGRNIHQMVSRDGKKNIRNDIAKDRDNYTEDINNYYKRMCLYSAAQAIRLVNTIASTHYQYASAIASSTAELNAVNDYENVMTGLGWSGSVAAGAAVGAKVGSIGGPVGTAIGATVGTAVAVANKAIKTATENRILNYKQAINATTSAYQLGVLGDATYGRSRQSIG